MTGFRSNVIHFEGDEVLTDEQDALSRQHLITAKTNRNGKHVYSHVFIAYDSIRLTLDRKQSRTSETAMPSESS